MFSCVRKEYIFSPNRSKRSLSDSYPDQCLWAMLSIIISPQITLAKIPVSASHFVALNYPVISFYLQNGLQTGIINPLSIAISPILRIIIPNSTAILLSLSSNHILLAHPPIYLSVHPPLTHLNFHSTKYTKDLRFFQSIFQKRKAMVNKTDIRHL